MRITPLTILYVVADGEVACWNIKKICDAYNGGQNLDELPIFTSVEEAQKEAEKSRKLAELNQQLSQLTIEQLDSLAERLSNKEIGDARK